MPIRRKGRKNKAGRHRGGGVELLIEERVDCLEQFFLGEWLHQCLFGAYKLGCGQTIVAAPISGDGDRTNVGVSGYEGPNRLYPVLHRHHDVCDHDVDLFLIEDLSALEAIGGFVDLVTLSRQEFADERG